MYHAAVANVLHFVVRCLALNHILLSTDVFGCYRMSFLVYATYLRTLESAKTADNAVCSAFDAR